MEVIHELLGVEKLKIYQDDTLNSFSVDSNILSSFVTIKKSDKLILDLGTGNAPIPLYLTLRTNAKIFGIEIQTNIYELAQKSVKINNKEDQIKLVLGDIKKIDSYFQMHSFDVVVSNPPFFKITKDSHTNPNLSLAISRHEIESNLEDFVRAASLMLKDKGVYALVHRAERLSDIIFLFRKYNIEPKRIRLVGANENKDFNQVLVEGIYKGHCGVKMLKPLYIHPIHESNRQEIIDIYNGIIKEK